MKITVVETGPCDDSAKTRVVDTVSYYFDENGNEYRYDSNGLRHYTRDEG